MLTRDKNGLTINTDKKWKVEMNFPGAKGHWDLKSNYKTLDDALNAYFDCLKNRFKLHGDYIYYRISPTQYQLT